MTIQPLTTLRQRLLVRIDFTDRLEIRAFPQEVMVNAKTHFSCNHERHLQKTIQGVRDHPFGRIFDWHDAIDNVSRLNSPENGFN